MSSIHSNRYRDLVNNVHVPYAAGFLLVHPGDDVAAIDDQIDTYFSEEYNFILPSFEERTKKNVGRIYRAYSPTGI